MYSKLENYYVAGGMNCAGIAAAGGVGKYLAEWIVDGEPSVNMWALDVRRFAELHNNRRFLKERVTESLSRLDYIPNDIRFISIIYRSSLKIQNR